MSPTWGAPGWGGSRSSLQPPAEASSCRGAQRLPKRSQHRNAPPRREEGGCYGSRPPSVRGWDPPNRRPAPAQTVRAPGGEGKLRPGQPFPSTEPDSTIQRAISQWQKKGTCREKGHGRPVLPQLLPAGTPIPHPSTGHLPTYRPLLAGTRQGPAAPSRPSAGSRARSPDPKASSRAKQEKLTLFSFPLPPVLQLPSPGPAAREGRAHCPQSPG